MLLGLVFIIRSEMIFEGEFFELWLNEIFNITYYCTKKDSRNRFQYLPENWLLPIRFNNKLAATIAASSVHFTASFGLQGLLLLFIFLSLFIKSKWYFFLKFLSSLLKVLINSVLICILSQIHSLPLCILDEC